MNETFAMYLRIGKESSTDAKMHTQLNVQEGYPLVLLEITPSILRV